MNECPIHHAPWKTVPAGVSKKTGNAYAAFQVCPIEGCKEKPSKKPVTETEAYKAFEEVGNSIKAGVAKEDPDWIKEADTKDDSVMSKAEWREKDDRIARLTIAKTYIQQGVDFDNAMLNGDLEKWELYVMGKFKKD